MILNHKDAILFFVENALEIEVTPFVIRNLHQLLMQRSYLQAFKDMNKRTARLTIVASGELKL